MPRPTDAELAILRTLWQRDPSTVREVHEVLARQGVRYTTTLKQLQVMFEKGLVTRDERERSHRYHAAVSEEATQQDLLEHLLKHAFGGSRSTLLLRALPTGTSREDLAAIRKLLASLDEDAS